MGVEVCVCGGGGGGGVCIMEAYRYPPDIFFHRNNIYDVKRLIIKLYRHTFLDK